MERPSDASLLNSRILVIDDNDANIALVDRLLEWAGFETVKTLKDSREALKTIDAFRPDLILLDLHMPHVDGFKILTELRDKDEEFGFMPVLVFTADGCEEAKTRALSLGASDFLTKPGSPAEIMQRVNNFLRARRTHVALQGQKLSLEQRVRERTAQLEEARIEIFESLARAAEFRDDETGEHTKRVGRLSRLIGESLGLSPAESELLHLAAQLHDIGKIGVPDSVLLKAGKLTPEEFEVMRRHAEIGGSILQPSKSPLMKMAHSIALHHHENWDGTGYPAGIAGESIPVCARIVAVADVFDALTHQRPYKPAWTEEEACAEIQKLTGTKFDPTVVKAFFDSRGQNDSLPLAA